MVLIMPTYDIKNKKTGEVKEIFCRYEEKEEVLKQEGSDWEYCVSAPSYSNNLVDDIKRAGSGWNDVLNNIKKGSAKDNNLNGNTY
jgi:hypothetical protein